MVSGQHVSSTHPLHSSPHRPRLLYCIPTHNNPRGTTIPLLRRQALLRLAHRHGFTILADEVYQCLTFPGALQPPPPLRHVEAAMVEGRGSETRVVSLSSFSKTMAAPGLRLGWVAARGDGGAGVCGWGGPCASTSALG